MGSLSENEKEKLAEKYGLKHQWLYAHFPGPHRIIVMEISNGRLPAKKLEASVLALTIISSCESEQAEMFTMPKKIL